jgi:hypothetical protein
MRALRLPAPLQQTRAARVSCPLAQLAGGRWRCSNVSVQIEFSDREALRFEAAVSLNPTNGALSMSAKQQAFAGGMLSVEFRSQRGGLDLDAEFSGLSVVTLQQLAALFGASSPVTASAGEVTGTIRSSDSKGARVLSVNSQLDGGAFLMKVVPMLARACAFGPCSAPT